MYHLRKLVPDSYERAIDTDSVGMSPEHAHPNAESTVRQLLA